MEARVRQTTRSLVLVALVAITVASPAVAGPVILGGDDLTDHGSRSGTTLSSGWLYIQKALENIAPAVTRSGNDGSVAVLGSADSTAISGDAGAAYHFAVPNAAATTPLTGTVSFYDGAAAINTFFTDLASGAVNPAIIVTAGTGANNDLDSSEGTALVGNAFAIANFVNSGGGLLSHGTSSTAYGWLTALIPGVSFPSGCDSTTLSLTTAGQSAFPGLTNTNIQSGPCHNNFLNHGLTVLATDADPNGGVDREIIIGGVATILPGQITLMPLVAFNPPGTAHTVTALVLDQSTEPLADVTVTFLVYVGPNIGTTGTAVTDQNGNASFSYTSNGSIGLDRIEASFVDPTNTRSPAAVVTTALKFWDLDCQANDIPDTCDIDCDGFGEACSSNFVTCGGSADADNDGIPDECNTPPVAICQDVTVSADSNCEGTAAAAPGDIDNGSFDPDAGDTITLSLSPSGPYPLGMTSVTLTVTDQDGASDSCTATVTVVDGPDTPPVITGCPQSISGSLDANCSFSAPDLVLQVDATDNCTATEDLVITTDPADLTTLGVGETAVKVIVTDTAGNFDSCTVTITIDVGACDQGGGNPPPPQPAPCDPSTGGVNILLSLLFHAPVCGVGCPLMIMLTFCGMLSLKARIRRRRRRRP